MKTPDNNAACQNYMIDFDKGIDATDWKSRLKLVGLSLLCQVQRIKAGDGEKWYVKGWFHWRTNKTYITWVRVPKQTQQENECEGK